VMPVLVVKLDGGSLCRFKPIKHDESLVLLLDELVVGVWFLYVLFMPMSVVFMVTRSSEVPPCCARHAELPGCEAPSEELLAQHLVQLIIMLE